MGGFRGYAGEINAVISEKTVTYEYLRAVPERLIVQIIEGELVIQPRSAPKHLMASSVLGGEAC